MKILFFGAKSYDIKSFDAYLDKEEYKDLDVVYIEPNLTPQTAMLAAGYEAVCLSLIHISEPTRQLEI